MNVNDVMRTCSFQSSKIVCSHWARSGSLSDSPSPRYPPTLVGGRLASPTLRTARRISAYSNGGNGGISRLVQGRRILTASMFHKLNRWSVERAYRSAPVGPKNPNVDIA